MLGLTALCLLAPVAGCTDEPTPGTPDASTPPAADAGDSGTTPTTDAAAGLLGFHPSNIDGTAAAALEAALNDPTLGDVELNDCGPQISASGIPDGRIGCDGPGEAYKQIEGSGNGDKKYAIFVAKNFHVASGRVLGGVRGDRPVILIAREKITIDGSIQMFEGFGGAYALPNAQQHGVGPGAGKGSSDTTSGSGGGGAFCGKGGNGGAVGATGGTPYGTPELIPLQGGSTGGALFASQAGGAIQLVAGIEIVLAAGSYIDARGDGNSSGGGSGGAILLEAPVVKVLGSLTANGGGGGAPGANAGKPGDRTSTPASGGQTPDNINGGNGGAGSTVDGTNGALNTQPPNDGTGSASGGGGAGRIRINTRSGAAEISGLVSPAFGSACASQGTLR